MTRINAYSGLGEQLETLFRNASRDIIVVAPFIKASTLSRLINQTQASVEVQCITRWRVDEIVAGVSDLEVWPLLRNRGNATLKLSYPLHAKYYRADKRCLIGSANISNSALGWRSPANLELLVPNNAADKSLARFEETIVASSVVVEDGLYESFRKLVEELEDRSEQLSDPPDGSEYEVGSSSLAVSEPISTDDKYDAIADRWWFPKSRNPAYLFRVYRGSASDMPKSAIQDALSDLRVASIPAGLNEMSFRRYVAAWLLQMPLVQYVDSFVDTSRRFGAVSRYIQELTGLHSRDDASAVWQTLMRWLLYYLPDKYESWEANYSEVFVRKKFKADV